MASTLSSGEEAQLGQTIEMFEVITQSQPNDFQSLEILKEAYSKLNREKDAVNTSKRIAQAYVQMGQLSSAILEYETILQRFPEDPEVQAALKQIENRANNFGDHPTLNEPAAITKLDSQTTIIKKSTARTTASDADDGRQAMYRIFVESKIITSGDFDLCWSKPDLSTPPEGVVDPFIQVLSDKAVLPLEKALKILTDKSRTAFLPLERYEMDIDLARRFPADTCRRWCVLPFDRMSKSILVATTNPFNQQAAKELASTTTNHVLWYVASPVELAKHLRKVFR